MNLLLQWKAFLSETHILSLTEDKKIKRHQQQMPEANNHQKRTKKREIYSVIQNKWTMQHCIKDGVISNAYFSG